MNCHGILDDHETSPLKAPLLLDMQTANVMLLVRAKLTTPKGIENFENLPWHQIAAICWKAVA